MTLILNTQGTLVRLRSATAYEEIARAMCAHAYEFFRTIGVLFYTRYYSKVVSRKETLDDRLLRLIDDYMNKPTFARWVILYEMCEERLQITGDPIAKMFWNAAHSDLPLKEREKIDSIRQKINLLQRSRIKKIQTPIDALKALVNLQNYLARESVSRSEIKEILDADAIRIMTSIIDQLMKSLDVRVIIPLQVEKNGYRCHVHKDLTPYFEILTDSAKNHPKIGVPYIWFSADEPIFEYTSNLLKYKEEEGQIHIYVRYLDGVAHYECVPPHGDVSSDAIPLESVRQVFATGVEDIIISDSKSTIAEKGKLPLSLLKQSMALPSSESQNEIIASDVHKIEEKPLLAESQVGSDNILPNQQLVSWINSYYTQSINNRNANEETRITGAPFYLRTKLQDKLLELIAAKKLKAIILTGNPGCGKTAVSFKLRDLLKGNGITDIDIISEGSSRDSEAMLRKVLSIINRALEGKKIETIHIVAINEGRLRDILKDPIYQSLHRATDVSIRDGLFYDEDKHVLILDLGRAYFGGLYLKSNSNEETTGLVDTFVKHQDWSKCNECGYKNWCHILANREIILSHESVRQSLELLIRASHYRGKQISIRGLLSILAYVIAGNRTCSDVARSFNSIEPFDEGIAASVLQSKEISDLCHLLLPNLAFENKGEHYMRYLAQFDPVLDPQPSIDQKTCYREPGVDSVPNYYRELLASLFERKNTEEDASELSKFYQRTIKRMLFFIESLGSHFGINADNSFRLSLLSYRSISSFEKLLNQELQSDYQTISLIVKGLNHLSGIYDGTGLYIDNRGASISSFRSYGKVSIGDLELKSVKPVDKYDEFCDVRAESLLLQHRTLENDAVPRLRIDLDLYEFIRALQDYRYPLDHRREELAPVVHRFKSSLLRVVETNRIKVGQTSFAVQKLPEARGLIIDRG